MAKISQEERNKKLEQYNAYIEQLFFTEGWDEVTLSRVAKHFNVSLSSVQRYFPRRKDLSLAFRHKLIGIVYEDLDVSSKATFVESWTNKLSQPRFRRIVEMFVHANMSDTLDEQASAAVSGLVQDLKKNMSAQDAHEAIEIAFGKVTLLNIQY